MGWPDRLRSGTEQSAGAAPGLLAYRGLYPFYYSSWLADPANYEDRWELARIR